VARRPEAFGRVLSMEEGRRQERITRTAKDPVKLRRAIVVMMSAQGQSGTTTCAMCSMRSTSGASRRWTQHGSA
jgi:hypothetical protein